MGVRESMSVGGRLSRAARIPLACLRIREAPFGWSGSLCVSNCPVSGSRAAAPYPSPHVSGLSPGWDPEEVNIALRSGSIVPSGRDKL